MLRKAYNLIMTAHLLIILSAALFIVPFLNFSLWPISWFCFVPLLYLTILFLPNIKDQYHLLLIF